MKKDRMKHEVWMGFPNYEGDINSITVIAKFCSKQRAMDYLGLILKSHPYEDNYSPRYGYKESGDDFVQIAYEGRTKRIHLDDWHKMLTDEYGYGWIKGAIA